jgi:hypothetical protein
VLHFNYEELIESSALGFVLGWVIKIETRDKLRDIYIFVIGVVVGADILGVGPVWLLWKHSIEILLLLLLPLFVSLYLALTASRNPGRFATRYILQRTLAFLPAPVLFSCNLYLRHPMPENLLFFYFVLGLCSLGLFYYILRRSELDQISRQERQHA